MYSTDGSRVANNEGVINQPPSAPSAPLLAPSASAPPMQQQHQPVAVSVGVAGLTAPLLMPNKNAGAQQQVYGGYGAVPPQYGQPPMIVVPHPMPQQPMGMPQPMGYPSYPPQPVVAAAAPMGYGYQQQGLIMPNGYGQLPPSPAGHAGMAIAADGTDGKPVDVMGSTEGKAGQSTEGLMDTIYDIQVNHRLHCAHLVFALVTSVLIGVSLAVSTWISVGSRGGSIGIFANDSELDYLPDAGTSVKTLRLTGKITFVFGILACVMQMICFLINSRVTSGGYTKKGGYGAIGILITLAGLLVVIMAIVYGVNSAPVMKSIDRASYYSVFGSSLSTGYILYIIGGSLATLNGLIIVSINKTISHAGSLAINLLLIGLFVAYIATGISYLLIGVGIVYAVYIIETLICSTMKYLKNILAVESAQMHIDRVRAIPPAIWMSIVCYHFETRYRTVTTRNANGSTSTRTESYQVRVNTYSERELFAYNGWRDLSGDCIGLEKYNVIKLKFAKIWSCGDLNTHAAFVLQAASLRDRNRFRDRHMDYADGMDIPGFAERLLAFTDINKKSPIVSASWFFVISAIGGSWFYRRYLDSIAVEKGFAFKKDVTI